MDAPHPEPPKRNCNKGMVDVATDLDAVRTDGEEGGGRELPGRGRGVRGKVRVSVVGALRAKPSGAGRPLARPDNNV